MIVDDADVRRALADMSSQFDLVAIGESEISRFAHTLSHIPIAKTPDSHLVDLGAHGIWVPLYVRILGYRKITIVRRSGQKYVDQFDFSNLGSLSISGADADLDIDPYPIADRSTDCVVCFEVLEHLMGDPMHLICETNRILKTGGTLILSTPNVLWRNNVIRYLFGGHPFGWPVYTSTYGDRHNREWTPFEVEQVLRAAGFDKIKTRTEDFCAPTQELSLLKKVISNCLLIPGALSRRVPFKYRGRLIFAEAQACGPVAERYPAFLYEMYGRQRVQVPFNIRRP